MNRYVSCILSFALASTAAAQTSPAPRGTPAAAPTGAVPATTPAARPDTTDPRMRNVPMRCRPGEVDIGKGRTLGQIFGADWPVAAEVAATARTPAQPLKLGRVEWPADAGQASAVSAVLVDAGGRPLRVQVICASKAALVAPVERAALAGRYRAATFAGAPATSVAIVAWRVGATDRAP